MNIAKASELQVQIIGNDSAFDRLRNFCWIPKRRKVKQKGLGKSPNPLLFLEPPIGLEPTTY